MFVLRFSQSQAEDQSSQLSSSPLTHRMVQNGPALTSDSSAAFEPVFELCVGLLPQKASPTTSAPHLAHVGIEDMVRREGAILEFLGELRQRQREDGDHVHRRMLWEMLNRQLHTSTSATGLLLSSWCPLQPIQKLTAI